MLADLSEYKRLTDVLNVTLADIDTAVPKGIDGMVTKVGERDLVEISLGSDDGLRVPGSVVSDCVRMLLAPYLQRQRIVREVLPNPRVMKLLFFQQDSYSEVAEKDLVPELLNAVEEWPSEAWEPDD